MSSAHDAVREAATAQGLSPLPSLVQDLLTRAEAPPRLIAHLHLVHDVAVRLTSGCAARLPETSFDTAAVAFGAATHDIGKALFPAELSASGSEHELAGEAWLVAQGTSPRLSRFARTHGLDVTDSSLLLDDLLVIGADKLWKGKRVATLEERVIGELAVAAGRGYWDAWPLLSALFDELAEGGDARLAWQAQFSALA